MRYTKIEIHFTAMWIMLLCFNIDTAIMEVKQSSSNSVAKIWIQLVY